ncbi:MAG TPA: hypothetical protein VIK01_05150 [Polyangiaceae bacterium]
MNTASDAAVGERYEALRAAVLAHRSGEERHGLLLMIREGLAAWIAAWASCSPMPPARTTAFAQPDNLPALAEPSAVVALLASMALATLQEQPS